MTVIWTGVNEADCIENFNKWVNGADPNAKYYFNSDVGKWVIEADAVKAFLPAIQTKNAEGQLVIMTPEDYDKVKPAKIAEETAAVEG